jgi:hypothetical protein
MKTLGFPIIVLNRKRKRERDEGNASVFICLPFGKASPTSRLNKFP